MNNDNPWNAIIKLTRKRRNKKNGTITLTYVPFHAFANDTRTVKVLIKETDEIIEILELAEYENEEVTSRLDTSRHFLVIQHIGDYFEKKVLLPVAVLHALLCENKKLLAKSETTKKIIETTLSACSD